MAAPDLLGTDLARARDAVATHGAGVWAFSQEVAPDPRDFAIAAMTTALQRLKSPGNRWTTERQTVLDALLATAEERGLPAPEAAAADAAATGNPPEWLGPGVLGRDARVPEGIPGPAARWVPSQATEAPDAALDDEAATELTAEAEPASPWIPRPASPRARAVRGDNPWVVHPAVTDTDPQPGRPAVPSADRLIEAPSAPTPGTGTDGHAAGPRTAGGGAWIPQPGSATAVPAVALARPHRRTPRRSMVVGGAAAAALVGALVVLGLSGSDSSGDRALAGPAPITEASDADRDDQLGEVIDRARRTARAERRAAARRARERRERRERRDRRRRAAARRPASDAAPAPAATAATPTPAPTTTVAPTTPPASVTPTRTPQRPAPQPTPAQTTTPDRTAAPERTPRPEPTTEADPPGRLPPDTP